jgi:uroporphyrin-III C-methyltransferase
MTPGKVYLVGAGPGHPELLTVKAAELLKTGDVIVYDRLVQEEVLALAKPSAERVFMGKAAGRHESRQSEIHELLVDKARQGRTVVRLKGGDPFVFGRGGEEAEYLAEHGVPFEVIPGVSSALAAPLSAGIAVTHRDAASAVAIVTGHEAKEDLHRLDWAALGRIDTLVFLMAVANVRRIAEQLIAHGRNPDTPAAMIQMAFWHDEHVVSSSLGEIAGDAERAGIKPPATLVIGEVVRMREKLQHAQRDLKRRADDSSRFQPAPAADQLFHLSTGAVASQALGLALDWELFDRLDQPQTIADLTTDPDLDAGAVEEILQALVALGLLESTSAGYRNLEIASRYLTTWSPESLRSTLLHQIGLATSWEHLKAYACHGDAGLPQSGNGDRPAEHASSEALARFTAPAVIERLDLGARGPLLHVGWGGPAFCEAAAGRWPRLSFTTINPFVSSDHLTALLECRRREPFGAVVVAGLLASCRRGEIDRLLSAVTAVLADRGLLVVHDAFLPAAARPPADLVLGALARHAARGGCRSWSAHRVHKTLRDLGYVVLGTEPMAAGTLLVTAERQAGR